MGFGEAAAEVVALPLIGFLEPPFVSVFLGGGGWTLDSASLPVEALLDKIGWLGAMGTGEDLALRVESIFEGASLLAVGDGGSDVRVSSRSRYLACC
jgi:hypothetical protein